MDTDRDVACAQLSGDLFAQPARDDERQNLSLSAGQAGVVLCQSSQLNSLRGMEILQSVRLDRFVPLCGVELSNGFVLPGEDLSFAQPARCLIRSNTENEPFGFSREVASIRTRDDHSNMLIRIEGKRRQFEVVASMQATQHGRSGFWLARQPLPERLTDIAVSDRFGAGDTDLFKEHAGFETPERRRPDH